MLPPLPRCSRRAYSSLKITHPCQPSPIPLSGRPAHRPFRGLLSVHSRCGLHTRAVTKFVTAIRGLQTFRRLHACPGCFRLERSPGGACTRWKSAALSRRTWIPVLGTRGFHRPLSDPSTDLQVRCHGSERDGRDVPRAEMLSIAWRGLRASMQNLSRQRVIITCGGTRLKT